MLQTNNLPQAIGLGKSLGSPESANTYRGILADWTNAENIAEEDFYRQLQQIDFQNQFNAQEAQKTRDWETEMSNTAYQRAVEDMKKAGLNPMLLYSSSGQASTPSGATASSGGGSNYKGGSADTGELLSILATIISVGAGLYNTGASNATKSAIAKASNANKLAVANTVRKSESFNQNHSWVYFGGRKKRK